MLKSKNSFYNHYMKFSHYNKIRFNGIDINLYYSEEDDMFFAMYNDYIVSASSVSELKVELEKVKELYYAKEITVVGTAPKHIDEIINHSKKHYFDENVFEEIDKVENTTIVTAILILSFLASAFIVDVEGMTWWRAIIEIIGQTGLTSIGSLIIYGIVSLILSLFRDLFVISSMNDYATAKLLRPEKRHVSRHIFLCIVTGVISIVITIIKAQL